MTKPTPCSCWKPAQGNTGTLDADALSRRSLLSGAAFAASFAAIGLAPFRARAQQKVAQATAQYQTSPKGDQRCDGCQHFQAPSSCQVVDGTISPSGWCALFVKKS